MALPSEILDEMVDAQIGKMFRIAWRGFPDDSATWEPSDSFEDVPEFSNLVRDWERRR